MTRLTLVKSGDAQAIITPLQRFYMQPGWHPITRRLCSPNRRVGRLTQTGVKLDCAEIAYLAFITANKTRRSCDEASTIV